MCLRKREWKSLGRSLGSNEFDGTDGLTVMQTTRVSKNALASRRLNRKLPFRSFFVRDGGNFFYFLLKIDFFLKYQKEGIQIPFKILCSTDVISLWTLMCHSKGPTTQVILPNCWRLCMCPATVHEWFQHSNMNATEPWSANKAKTDTEFSASNSSIWTWRSRSVCWFSLVVRSTLWPCSRRNPTVDRALPKNIH